MCCWFIFCLLIVGQIRASKKKKKAGEGQGHEGSRAIQVWFYGLFLSPDERRRQEVTKEDNRRLEVCGLLINPPFIYSHHCTPTTITALGVLKEAYVLRGAQPLSYSFFLMGPQEDPHCSSFFLLSFFLSC